MERINHFLNSLMLFMHTHYYTFIHKLFTFCTIGILNLLICLQSKLLTAFTDCVLQNPQNSGLTAKTVPWIFRPLYVRHTVMSFNKQNCKITGFLHCCLLLIRIFLMPQSFPRLQNEVCWIAIHTLLFLYYSITEPEFLVTLLAISV